MLQYEQEWPERFFHTRTWRGVSGMHETLLMLGGRTHEQLPGVRLLLNLTCTNGAFPRMSLQQALFDTDYSTGNLSLRGRTRSLPSRPCYPPTTPRYQWEVMSLLHPRALSFLINNVENLRFALGLFDWMGAGTTGGVSTASPASVIARHITHRTSGTVCVFMWNWMKRSSAVWGMPGYSANCWNSFSPSTPASPVLHN